MLAAATPIRIFWAGVIVTALAVLASFVFSGASFADDRLNPLGGLSVGDVSRFLLTVLSPIQQVAGVLGPILIGTSFVVAAIDRAAGTARSVGPTADFRDDVDR